jgi:hypothetical protein
MKMHCALCLSLIAGLVTAMSAQADTFIVSGSGFDVFNQLTLSGTVDINTVLGTVVSGSIAVSNAGAFDGTYDTLADQGFETSSTGNIYFADFTGSLLPTADNLNISIALYNAASLAGYSGGGLCGPLELGIACGASENGVGNASTGLSFEGELTQAAAPEPAPFLLMAAPMAWFLVRRPKRESQP